jgi:hypothetical protein
VLAVTLWLLAGVAVSVGLMMLWARAQVERARLDSERFQDEVAVSETRDTLLYIGATREMTRAGLPMAPVSEDTMAMRRLDEFGGLSRDPVGGELRLDGSRYQGRGETSFALQDETGLFSILRPSPVSLDRFLHLHGVSAESIPRLRDTLLDYMDSDDLVRLEGAEGRDYAREHRPPPPNRSLLLPSELARVPGWDRLAPATLRNMAALATVNYGGGVNLNTVPAALLPMWIPNCPEGCEAVLRQRRRQALGSTAQVELLAGGRLPGDDLLDYRYMAGDTLRLDVWGRKGRGQRYHVKFTPLADQRGPWTILAAYPVERPADDDIAEAIDSPLLSGP